MTAVTFDTLKLSRKLESAGFTHDQAVGAAEALADTFSDGIATQADIADLKQDIGTLKGDIASLELRLTIRMGVMFGANVGIIALLFKFFLD